MAWTAPRTWTAGEVVTDSIMNTHVRDNLLETAPGKVTTAGDLLYATAANAIARLGIGTALQKLRTNSGATAPEWFTEWAIEGGLTRKSANEVVNNSGALQNDDHLLQALGASQTWMFEAHIICQGPDAADIKIAFTVPSGATLTWSAIGPATGATGGGAASTIVDYVSVSGTAATFGTDGNPKTLAIHVRGMVRTAGTTGNLQLQWAQSAATANDTTVYTDSWLLALRVA